MEGNGGTELKWPEIVDILKFILESGLPEYNYNNATEMAKAIGVSGPSMCRWMNGTNRCKSPAKIKILTDFVTKFIEKNPDRFESIPASASKNDAADLSVKRKVEIIAQNLEIILPLMVWFVNHGTKEHRDYLRKILGTELSYEIFNISRALLTENHRDKAKNEGALNV